MSEFIAWNEIKTAFEALISEGKTPHAASLDLAQRYPVTRQGIRKRAAKEGWTGSAKAGHTLRLAGSFSIVADPNFPKATPERVASILQAIADGASEKLAAISNNIAPTLITHWKQADEQFKNAVEAAAGQRARHRIAKVEEASDRGDWKATAFLLARDATTREEYGEQQSKGGIAIQINITRGDDVQAVTLP